jgi:hypothetical protein
VAVDPDGAGPSRRFDASSSWAETRSPSYLREWKAWTVDVTEAPPRYLLAVISNVGTAPLTWRAGVNHPNACVKLCGDHYGPALRDQGCPEAWCTASCNGISAAECQRLYDNCLTAERNRARGTAMFFYCPWLCGGAGGLREPYSLDYDPSCTATRAEVCSASGIANCETTPAAFVSLPAWPAARCVDIMQTGAVKCGP